MSGCPCELRKESMSGNLNNTKYTSLSYVVVTQGTGEQGREYFSSNGVDLTKSVCKWGLINFHPLTHTSKGLLVLVLG